MPRGHPTIIDSSSSSINRILQSQAKNPTISNNYRLPQMKMGRIQMESSGVNYRCSPRDLDFGFTSHSSPTSNFTASTSTSTSTSAHSSPTVSFNHRLSPIITNLHRPHRHHDPHWSAIRSATKNSPDGTLHLHHIKLIRQLGAGDLGRVFLCRIRNDHHHHSSTSSSHFALKVIDRNLLTPSKHAHLETEAKILAHLDHPFLPTLYARIDASHYTCFLIDYCPGGDLNTLIQRIHSRRERLPLSAVRFYAAEILIALEYLHSKGIVYRDLKPENILIREDGHIMLSDFDLCFTSEVTARIEPQQSNLTRSGKNKKKNHNEMEVVAEPVSAYSRSCVGTHEYLAPELVYGKGHGNGVDWWAFGVLIYEMMYGTTPFKGMDKEETVRNIAVKEGVEFPCEVTGEEEMVFRDLIGRLLVKDPSMRLGCERGAAEIKRHLFFSGVNWALIREYTPPGMVTRGCLTVRKKSSGGGRSGGGISGKGHGLGLLSPRRRMRWGWRRLRNLLKNRRV